MIKENSHPLVFEIKTILKKFHGDYAQKPPMFGS